MPLNPTTPALTRIGFTGQEQDGDMGLTDMKGRIYDPLAGRFMSADPIMQAPFWSQGLNRYSYVFNNPVNYTDPSGFVAEGLGYFASNPSFTGTASGAAGSALGGVLGAGGNVFSSLAMGLPGGAQPGGSYSVTPSATAKSSAVTPQTVQAKGQNQSSLDISKRAELLRQKLDAVPDRRTAQNCTGSPFDCLGAEIAENLNAIQQTADAAKVALAEATVVALEAVAELGADAIIEIASPFTMESDAAPYEWYSKSQHEREGDGTRGKTYDQIREAFKDRLKPGELKKLIEKVQKLRGERNVQKRLPGK